MSLSKFVQQQCWQTQPGAVLSICWAPSGSWDREVGGSSRASLFISWVRSYDRWMGSSGTQNNALWLRMPQGGIVKTTTTHKTTITTTTAKKTESSLENSLSRQTSVIIQTKTNLHYFARLICLGPFLACASGIHKQNLKSFPKLIWGNY